MITIAEAFEKFKTKLEPGEREEADAIRRRERVKAVLEKSFGLDSIFITGSYKRWTKTKPLRDVDLFCVLNQAKEGGRLKKSSRLVLNDFGAALEEEFGKDNVKVWDKCVTVKFGDPTGADDDEVFSVDVVPAFEDGKAYKIPDTSHPEGWMKTDPEIHQEKSTEANKNMGGKWVALVKMAKKCNEFHDKPIEPSFLVEVMALQLMVPPFSGGYKYEMKNFIASAAASIDKVWPDPAGLGPAVSSQMTPEKRQTAKVTLAKIGRAIDRALLFEQQGRVGDALAVWRNEVFGPMFPMS